MTATTTTAAATATATPTTTTATITTTTTAAAAVAARTPTLAASGSLRMRRHLPPKRLHYWEPMTQPNILIKRPFGGHLCAVCCHNP